MEMAANTNTNKTKRFSASTLDLLRDAAGGPRQMAEKAGRFVRAVRAFADGEELEIRLGRLQRKGYIERPPTRAQLAAGGFDMFRFWIAPASAEYYREQGIDFGFHQILRILDEPSSLVDFVGLFSTRDGIIGHLMQVVHANPVYDLELLEIFDDGLDELEAQLEQMIAGTHPRAQSIGAIIEEPRYHRDLLDYTRRFREDPSTPSLLRSNIEQSSWSDLERTFGSLRTSMRYFLRMPSAPLAAARHALVTKRFPVELAEPRR